MFEARKASQTALLHCCRSAPCRPRAPPPRPCPLCPVSVKGATDVVLSRSDAKPIKDTLKVTGAAWLTAAAHMAYRAHVRWPARPRREG